MIKMEFLAFIGTVLMVFVSVFMVVMLGISGYQAQKLKDRRVAVVNKLFLECNIQVLNYRNRSLLTIDTLESMLERCTS